MPTSVPSRAQASTTSSTSPRACQQSRQRQRPGRATTTARSTSCRPRRLDAGERERAAPPAPRLVERLVHAHRQQIGGVEEPDRGAGRAPSPARGRRPRRGDRPTGASPPRGEERFAANGHALPVRQRAVRRAWAACPAGRTGRRASSASPGAASATAPVGHSNRPATVSRSRPSASAPRDERGGQRGSGRVSASRMTTHSVRGRQQTLLERPRLAGPSGRQRPCRRTTRAPSRVASVGRRVARLVVDDDHLGDARRPDDRGEQRADPRRLVAGRHDDADRPQRRHGAGAPAVPLPAARARRASTTSGRDRRPATTRTRPTRRTTRRSVAGAAA